MVENSGKRMGGQSGNRSMYFKVILCVDLDSVHQDYIWYKWSGWEEGMKGVFFLLFFLFLVRSILLSVIIFWNSWHDMNSIPTSHLLNTAVITVSHICTHTQAMLKALLPPPPTYSLYSLTTYSSTHTHTHTLPVRVPSPTASSLTGSQSSIASPEAGGNYSQQG